jgi:putative ABC transport system substrate-binding protein
LLYPHGLCDLIPGDWERAVKHRMRAGQPVIVRRDLISLFVAAPLIGVAAREACGQAKKYLIGTLNTGAPLSNASPFGAGLIRGLGQLGYTLDQNYSFVRRGAEFHPDALPRLLNELEASHVDVVVCFGYDAANVAKGKPLPVVSFTAGDPVGTGLVTSLARPGGNITGISDVSAEVTPKRLQYLRDLRPELHRVAILYNAADPGMTLRYQAAQAGATAQRITVQALGVREPNDFDQAFATMNAEMPDAILMVSDILTNLNRKRVFEFAGMHRLPAIYENNGYVRDGGLISYGPDVDESLERAASLVDRILRGAKPADLPFEQPTLFRLAINLKTANALGLTVPQLLLAQADEVIE